jgi:hypothetical protein
MKHTCRRKRTHAGFCWGNQKERAVGRRKLEGNIQMDLRDTGWDVMDWIDLVEDRDQWWALVNAIMNIRVPQDAGKF